MAFAAALLLLSRKGSGEYFSLIPDGLSRARQSILGIALDEVGVEEDVVDGEGSNWSDAIAQYNYGVYDPEPWCVRFAKWVYQQAFDAGRIPEVPYTSLGGGGSTSRTRASAEEMRRFMPVGSYTPRPADFFIMEGHTGLVLGTSPDGNEINTVEGNSRNRVRIGRRRVRDLQGFINVLDDPHVPLRFERRIFDGDPDIRFRPEDGAILQS